MEGLITSISAGQYDDNLDEIVRKYNESMARLGKSTYVLFSEIDPVYFMLLMQPRTQDIKIERGNTLLGVTSRSHERTLEVVSDIEKLLGIGMNADFSNEGDSLVPYMSRFFLAYEHEPHIAMGLLLSRKSPFYPGDSRVSRN